VIQGDGKIVVGGKFSHVITRFATLSRNNILRLFSDGSVDMDFNPNANAMVNTVVLHKDFNGNEGVFVGGYFTKIAGYNAENHDFLFLARLFDDGSIDEQYTSKNSLNGPVSSITIQANGFILVGGFFDTFSSHRRINLIRFNPLNTLDICLVSEAEGQVYVTAEDAAGNILIGGEFKIFDGRPQRNLARVDTCGRLDKDYLAPSQINGDVLSSAHQLIDNKTLIVGRFWKVDGVRLINVARLNEDGTLDETFVGPELTNVNGTSVVKAVVVQPDGKILIGGNFSYKVAGIDYKHIARLSNDGSLDEDFIPPVISEIDEEVSPVNSVILSAGGSILLGGSFKIEGAEPKQGIARLQYNGRLDQSFDPQIYLPFPETPYVASMAIHQGGEIVVVGKFSKIGGANGIPRRNIARLRTNGELDASLNITPNNVVKQVRIQAQGEILITGKFTHIDGIRAYRIARLMSSGGLDKSYISLPYTFDFSADITGLEIQDDGKILVAGQGSIHQTWRLSTFE